MTTIAYKDGVLAWCGELSDEGLCHYRSIAQSIVDDPRSQSFTFGHVPNGGAYARGAMDAGATARDAVTIAANNAYFRQSPRPEVHSEIIEIKEAAE